MVRVMAKLDNMMLNISIDGKRKRYFMWFWRDGSLVRGGLVLLLLLSGSG